MPRTDYEMMVDLYESVGQPGAAITQADTAHLVIQENKVLGAATVPGLHVEPETTDTGVRIRLRLDPGVRVAKQVHLCFGVLPEEGVQEIDMDAEVGEGSSVSLLAHCVFPNAVNVTHRMQADIRVGPGAEYEYLERHVHSEGGGVLVLPKARVQLAEGARVRAEFDLLQGRVGRIDIDYEVTCGARSTLDMLARINGRGTDEIKIREAATLEGESSRAVLRSRVALRDKARAEILNEITALAAGCRGHVDCKEIVQGEGSANAVPIVTVRHPLAHVTHEAAIGSVDDKQLVTLMARGLSEDDAVEAIIQGLLS